MRRRRIGLLNKKERPMRWKKPRFVEIPLGAEINCYAGAEPGK